VQSKNHEVGRDIRVNIYRKCTTITGFCRTIKPLSSMWLALDPLTRGFVPDHGGSAQDFLYRLALRARHVYSFLLPEIPLNSSDELSRVECTLSSWATVAAVRQVFCTSSVVMSFQNVTYQLSSKPPSQTSTSTGTTWNFSCGIPLDRKITIDYGKIHISFYNNNAFRYQTSPRPRKIKAARRDILPSRLLQAAGESISLR